MEIKTDSFGINPCCSQTQPDTRTVPADISCFHDYGQEFEFKLTLLI